MMAESVFEKLAGRVAVNKQSAQSAFGSGTHYTPKYNPSRMTSADPLPIKPIPDNCDAAELVGVKYGRLTVLGLHDRPTTGPANWVVRCVCGNYETRKAKTIRKRDMASAECEHCEHRRRLQKRSLAERLGYEKAEAIMEPWRRADG
jgi:hypothetical protein